MDEIECFRAALKYLLKDRGAQSNLALDAHISEGYVSQLISGKRVNPSRRTLMKIAFALKTTYQEMITLGERLCTVQTTPFTPLPTRKTDTVTLRDILKLREDINDLTKDFGKEIGDLKRDCIDILQRLNEAAETGDIKRLGRVGEKGN